MAIKICVFFVCINLAIAALAGRRLVDATATGESIAVHQNATRMRRESGYSENGFSMHARQRRVAGENETNDFWKQVTDGLRAALAFSGTFGRLVGGSVKPTHQPTTCPTSKDPYVSSLHQSTTFEDPNVQVWLDADVTLADGVKYEVVSEIYHDPTAFTQGLTYANGTIFESTGLRGQSTVRIVDPDTGAVRSRIGMPSQYFGEGMVLYQGTLVQLTYTSATGFVYDASDLTVQPTSFQYQTTRQNQGWGITWYPDRDEFIVTDGSNNLIFWDTSTYEILRTVPVFRQSGIRAMHLNELEFWRGRLLANVWLEDVLLVIHPETGVVEKEYDFSMIHARRSPLRAVFNGISVSCDPQLVYVTGKNWDTMYLIKLLH